VAPSLAVPVPKQILAQATRLFAARGFDGVSLQEIADAVGVTKPTLLYHFPSKDDLRKKVLEAVLAHWNDVLPALLQAATSGKGQFDAILAETIGFFAADPDRARLVLREALDRPDGMLPLLKEWVQPWAAIVSGYIRKGQEQGRVHLDVDPEAFVVSVVNLVLSTLATSHLTSGFGTSPERQTREALRFARAALFKE
jgi:AcrR family transcriptional regulator